jgi:hypothetical protein
VGVQVCPKCCPHICSKEENRGGRMLGGDVERPGVTSGQPYTASKGLIRRGFQGRAQVWRRAKGSSLTQSIWSS